jgi:hypothetical protein
LVAPLRSGIERRMRPRRSRARPRALGEYVVTGVNLWNAFAHVEAGVASEGGRPQFNEARANQTSAI